MVKIFALDQAGKTGWARGSSEGESHRSGLWALPPPDEYGNELPVFLGMRRRLTEAFEEEPFDIIAFEEPQFINGQSSVGQRIQLLGLVAVVQLFGHDHNIPAYSVPLDDWRQHFIGARRAPRHINVSEARTDWWKRKAVEACSFRMWDCHSDHNEAEARGILDYSLTQASQSYFSKVRPLLLRQESHIKKEGAY